MTHPQYPIPQDEEGRKRYESAKRHAALAKEQGKSLMKSMKSSRRS